MNKKILIPILVSGVLFAGLSFNNSFNKANAGDAIVFNNDTIQALSHKDGMVVNFVNSDIAEYWDSDASDIEKLKTLYEMNDEISSFADVAFNHKKVRELYAKWDDFKPTNNTLTWKSNVVATSYDVVVSLDAELTKAVYEEKGLTEASYTMSNPYANTHYYWQVTAHTNNGNVKSSIFDFYSGDYKRTVDIPTISNTRDVGGFTGAYGTMQQGLIYRSGRLDDYSSEAQEALAQLDIQTDLDLRNSREGLENPAHLTNYYLRPIPNYYYNAYSESTRMDITEAMRVFANPNNYPIVFHCAVGRDRTGTLASLLQALCGASREYIIHDYYTSMWSVTGAYQKTLTDLNYNVIDQTLSKIESFGTSLADGAEKFLKLSGGLTDQEITAIRDIWSGKTEVAHGLKTFKAEENYEGKAFVKIKATGHKDICMMVDKGSVITAPYALDDAFDWYSNGNQFDFATAINETTFIYADYAIKHLVTIHFTGISKQDETLLIKNNETISFNSYKLKGFKMVAISDEGRAVTELVVIRDTYVNIVYSK